MSQGQNNNQPKINLNLGAKEYIPKLKKNETSKFEFWKQMNPPLMNFDSPYSFYQNYLQMMQNYNSNFNHNRTIKTKTKIKVLSRFKAKEKEEITS